MSCLCLLRSIVIASLGLFAALPVLAQGSALANVGASPVGVWRSIDDETGKAKALIAISESGGQLSGRIEKLIDPDEPANPRCEKCEGTRKDQPVTGMTVLWGLKPSGEEWTGGEILDPKNGKVYRAKLKLVDGGKKLEVRGFIGFALLGRTQTWVREP